MSLDPAAEAARPRLLVVDDQPANLQVLYRTFAADHQVFMATGGLQALQQCRRHLPDLVLLDIGMPDVDGHEVCRRLKADPATRDIPVIFVTGHDDDGQEALGLDLGAVDFIAKPVNPGVVRARVRTHLALARSTALLAATLEATAEGILVTDAAGRIGSLNQRFVQLWQLPPELLDAPDATVFSHLREQAADPARHDRELAAALSATDDRLDRIELTGDRHLERRTTVLRVNGAAAGHVLSFRDVTAERRAARELRQLNDGLEARIAERTRTLEDALRQADAANRAKSAFLSNVSHEIRTPLSGVIGLVHLALRADPSPTVRGHLEKIRSSGEQLLAIVGDILDFSRLEAGRLAMDDADFSLPAMVESIGAQVEPALTAQGLAFDVTIDPALRGALRGDGPRLRQVLLNLVQNAVKFTAAGRVALRATAGARDPHGVAVSIEVEDTGIGMAPELIAELFQPFHQADASSTRPYGGTGIGLAICKRLCDLMGGTVSVRSTPGVGSTFTVALRLAHASAPGTAPAPAATDAHTEPATAPPPTPRAPSVARPAAATFELSPEANPALAGRRVLVVEDNAINREVATGLLEAAGVVVDVAHDGQQALDRLATHRYDAVLMDLQMPVMDGVSATRAIRADARFDGMPVLAMTANADVVDRARCTAVGMVDFIVKPVMPAVLYTALARALVDHAPAEMAAAPTRSPLPPCAAPEGDPELIDVSALLPLTRGEPAKLRRYLEVFRQSLVDARAELDAALDADDRAAIGLVGLRLKSSAAAVGAAGLATLFRTLERQSGHASRPELQELVQRVVRRSLAIDDEIARIFAVLPPSPATATAPGDRDVASA